MDTMKPLHRRLMHTANENCQFFNHVFFLYFGKFLAKIICHAINIRNFNLGNIYSELMLTSLPESQA